MSAPMGAAVIVALICVFASGCGSRAEERAGAKTPDLSSTSLDCLMEAQTTAKLSAAVPGLLSRVLVNRGIK